MVNVMHKRGQVSVFAVVGIVIVILVALFFFARSEFGLFVAPTSFLSEKSQPIEDNLKTCVGEVTREALDVFSKQGGNFDPVNYRLYQSRAVSYYCTNIPGEDTCLNVIPPFSKLVSDLNSYIQEGVNDCVDEDLVRGGLGYEVEAGDVVTTVNADGDSLLVKANYDVVISKGEVKSTIRDVNVAFDVPLEEIYSVSVDIVNSEASFGFFEQLLYMVAKKGEYVINLDKPYPDKIYKIQKRGSDFEFWFAVEGERSLYG